MPAPATVTKTSKIDPQDLMDRIRKIKGAEVLVGIPAGESPRKDGEMNNATLAFIHTHGSPLQNIPARPFLEPGIKKVDKLIARQIANAAQAMITGDPEKAEKSLQKAGLLGSNSAKRMFTDPGNGWPPNSPLTIARKGSDKPLIDTEQLRKSITYVVGVPGSGPIKGTIVTETKMGSQGVLDLVEVKIGA